MPQTQLPVAIDVEAELEKIARRYKGAGGVGINVLNLIGGQAESLLDRLPAQHAAWDGAPRSCHAHRPWRHASLCALPQQPRCA